MIVPALLLLAWFVLLGVLYWRMTRPGHLERARASLDAQRKTPAWGVDVEPQPWRHSPRERG